MRTTCAKVVDEQTKLIGTMNEAEKIDESYFCETRKYGNGILLRSDLNKKYSKLPTAVDQSYEEDIVSYALLNWGTAKPPEETVDADNDFLEFGRDDPNCKWVIGVY